MRQLKNLVGHKFGKLRVVGFSHMSRAGSFWFCKCDCGNEKIIRGVNLTKGNSRSCGCLVGETASLLFRKKHKDVDGKPHKQCSTCLKYKTLNNFTKSKGLWDGLEGRCKECESKRRLAKDRQTTNKNWRNRYQSSYKNNVDFLIKKSLSGRIRKALKGIIKKQSTEILVGCSFEKLKIHLESMFDDNMSWGNYGKYWQIDHIRPCVSFDLSDPEQQKQCFHYSNLQPMRTKENISKNSYWNGVLIRKGNQ